MKKLWANESDFYLPKIYKSEYEFANFFILGITVVCKEPCLHGTCIQDTNQTSCRCEASWQGQVCNITETGKFDLIHWDLLREREKTRWNMMLFVQVTLKTIKNLLHEKFPYSWVNYFHSTSVSLTKYKPKKFPKSLPWILEFLVSRINHCFPCWFCFNLRMSFLSNSLSWGRKKSTNSYL